MGPPPASMELPRLEAPRLVLRIPSPDDAERIAAYHLRNREIFAPWSPPRDEDYFTAAWWRERLPMAAVEVVTGRAERFIGLARGALEGPMICEVNLTNIVRGCFQACSLSYSLDERHGRRGLATEAVKRVVAHAFDDLRLHRITASYVPTNERSAALLRRLQFEIEGKARDAVFIGGAWRDQVLTALVNPHPTPPA